VEAGFLNKIFANIPIPNNKSEEKIAVEFALFIFLFGIYLQYIYLLNVFIKVVALITLINYPNIFSHILRF
jgi:hypothetical protein